MLIVSLYWCGVAAAALPITNATRAVGSAQILIKPKTGVDAAALEKFHASLQVQVVRRFLRIGNIQVLRGPKDETAQDLVARYRSSGLVEFAEADYVVHAAATIPNDPRFLDGTLWGLNNFGQENGMLGADIGAVDAWDIQTSASNVVVAILDTGVRFTHEDLAANMWVNTNDSSHGYNAFTESNVPNDDQGHGTMVAGIVGAEGNNGKGVTGVAWHVQLMACKCLDNEGIGYSSTVIACMQFALTNGARIVNASFSSTEASEAVSNAIVSLREAGIIVVAPVGDMWSDADIAPRYPACYDLDNIVSVASVTREDQLECTSNYGATNVDLAAPGDQIYSTYFEADDSYYPTNFPQDGLSGTSFAAAYVSGALALMQEKYSCEDYRQTLFRLLQTTTPIADLEGRCVTGGRLNLKAALSPPIRLLPLCSGTEPFALRAATGPYRTCAIEASEDLILWNPVFTNTTTTNWTFDFVDEGWTNSSQKFYRAVLLP